MSLVKALAEVAASVAAVPSAVRSAVLRVRAMGGGVDLGEDEPSMNGIRHTAHWTIQHNPLTTGLLTTTLYRHWTGT